MSAAFEPALMADALVNLMASAGIAIVARADRRIDPKGAVTKRIVFALSVVSALFCVRAIGWMAGSLLIGRLASALAGATPLVGLFVVEGLLRRHAPRSVKIVLTGGCILVAVLSVFDSTPDLDSGAIMLVVVFGGYVTLACLLLTRDAQSLTAPENRAIRRLLVAVAFLLPLIVTDFRSVFPAIPVRLGALGVLIVLYVSFGAGGLSTPGRTRFYCLTGFLLIAVTLALGFGATRGEIDESLLFTIAAVGFSSLVLAALLSEEIGARGERARPPSPILDARDAATFEAALKADPLLQDARILTGATLGDVDGPQLQALLARHGVLRRKDAPWGLPAQDGGVERALSLMLTYDATHILRLGRAHLRLAAFTLPAIANDPRAEAEIVLAQRLGETLYADSDGARVNVAAAHAQT
jgi:hypothetical protein